MKKFLFCVFILLIFCGVGFFIGWTQFRVKPEEIGVVISKTNGVDETPVENGKFSWHWQFLLPTNATLKTFSIKPANVVKKTEGSLPSGNFYAVYGSQDDFSYSFEYSMSLTVSPQTVVQLIKLNQITDNRDLEEYLSKAADLISQLTSDYLLTKIQKNPKFRAESVRRDDLLNAIQIYKENPFVELVNFSLVSSKIPDFELYDNLKRKFMTESTKIVSEKNKDRQDAKTETENSNEIEEINENDEADEFEIEEFSENATQKSEEKQKTRIFGFRK